MTTHTPAPGSETPGDARTTPPPQDTDVTDTPTEDQPPAAEEDKPPAPRSLEWWKAKAREHASTIETLTAERDHLQSRLDTVQQREVESLVSDRLHDPSDFTHYGPPLAELRDAHGDVDPGLVHAALTVVVQQHPHLSKRHGVHAAAPASAVTARGVPDLSDAKTKSFQDLLQGAVRGRR
ncbi:hypothetical protein [Mycobacterium sp. SMC-4]|uniref:hypothetical protein n=1 Tax=Mycobacterium sp. SMC-4 TaxID=2857059 RepID=UPI0021B3816A|nr:hypothetical protein [Mycobacterium sp. SMC-4]UXA19822.1 hypothetical protein KXD98_09650 [Mycobacterium sp. SMC-4]